MKSSQIRLYQNVKIDSNNVTNLSSANLLTALESHKVLTFTNVSIVLETYTLRVQADYYTVLPCNYMAFLNNDYSNKWFFCFIESVKYISDAVTEISFSIDRWSTYYSDMTFLKCLVEREITATDVIGEHTLDEGLDVGRVESISLHHETIADSDTDYWVVLETGWDLRYHGKFLGELNVINSGFTGNKVVFFPIDVSATDNSSVNQIRLYLLGTNLDGAIDFVGNMFLLPYTAVSQADLQQRTVSVVSTDDCTYYEMKNDVFGADNSVIEFDKVTSFSDYVPLNKKLFCYPYNYLYLTNNIGNQNIFKYEDFDSSTKCQFRKESAFAIGGSIRIYPINYRGQNDDYDEQIPAGKFPVCGWSADSYTNWLTQNSVNNYLSFLGLVSETKESTTNTATQETEAGQKLSAIKGGVSLARHGLGIYDNFRLAKLLPNIQGGSQNNGDVSFAGGSISFDFYSRRARLENIKEIDDYFTRFGYKVNTLKIPNLTTSRLNHFYIKIASGEKVISGNIPKESIDFIENQCYQGITIWKSLDNIGNYETGTEVNN